MAIINPMVNMLRRLMPIPGLMPENLRRRIVNPVIYAMKRAGHPLDAIKETVDSFMGPTRWLQYGRDISKLTSMADKVDMLFNWNRDKVFTQKAVVETYLKGNENYMISGSAILHDSDTGDTWSSPVSFYDDTLRTPEEYRDQFEKRFVSGKEYKSISVIGFDINAVLHDVRRPR